MSHPARWTPAILDALAPILAGLGMPVHDPFAGTGERLGQLCDRLELPYSGTEIEPEWITDPRVKQGDSTTRASYPTQEHVIVTSPVYPSGMADHFHARDGSRRHTYRQGLAAILGHDRPLAETNMGRYGVRSGKRAEARYWALASASVRWWPRVAIVNVSDFAHARRFYPLVGLWRGLLAGCGYTPTGEVEVPTPRQRHGANGHLRAEHETVLIWVR